ncbi:hotdog fold thioesterase [Erwinia endophytica]|uniref:hotdog fold thioesterase n=1 Tax=Erwinia endophytica TaxID=1563158 RepID=UPI0012660027|nr:hotdog fold thioesterase [Erwinia endophytica]KAB8307398.1 hotdog fold thioesterase [Erwinia endophytica]
MIWKRPLSLEDLNHMVAGSMISQLGMVFTHLDDRQLEATMPVDERTRQPFGLLHGGASAALAETLGSMAGYLASEEGQCVVGTEISASHHRAVTRGEVRGVCCPLHLGRSQQVWEIVIFDRDKRCCTARLTTALLG